MLIDKCEDKFDEEKCSKLVLTNGVDGKCGDSSALWRVCCAYCKAEKGKTVEGIQFFYLVISLLILFRFIFDIAINRRESHL